MLLQIFGYPERALAQLNKGLMLARELEHPPSMVQALWFGAETNFLRRDPRMVMQIVEEWLPMVSLHGSAVGIANAMMLRGWALIMSGQREAGCAELRDGLGRFRTTGSKFWVSYRLGRAAEAFQKRRTDTGEPGPPVGRLPSDRFNWRPLVRSRASSHQGLASD